MTLDRKLEELEDIGEENPELQKFLETGEGGTVAVKLRPTYKIPKVKNQIRRVNARQQAITRRIG